MEQWKEGGLGVPFSSDAFIDYGATGEIDILGADRVIILFHCDSSALCPKNNFESKPNHEITTLN